MKLLHQINPDHFTVSVEPYTCEVDYFEYAGKPHINTITISPYLLPLIDGMNSMILDIEEEVAEAVRKAQHEQYMNGGEMPANPVIYNPQIANY